MMAEPKELINTHRYMYVSNGSGQHLSNDGSSPALDEAQFSYGLRTLPLVCLRTLLLDVAGKMSQLMSQSFIQVCNMIACAVERLSAAMASFHCGAGPLEPMISQRMSNHIVGLRLAAIIDH